MNWYRVLLAVNTIVGSLLAAGATLATLLAPVDSSGRISSTVLAVLGVVQVIATAVIHAIWLPSPTAPSTTSTPPPAP